MKHPEPNPAVSGKLGLNSPDPTVYVTSVRKFIHRSLGWKESDPSLPCCTSPWYRDGEKDATSLPHYESRLHAIRAALLELPESMKSSFGAKLNAILEPTNRHQWEATALELCEAYILTRL